MKRLHTYSQNFLRNPQLVSDLLKRTTVTADDTVYDLGAGSGVISAVLAKKAKAVVAVEYEPSAVATLCRNMERFTNVTVVQSDILKVTFPKTPYKIVANIPFHISSPIVQRFFNTPDSPEVAYLIVQKQFGKKLVASDTTHFTSQLGMIIGAEYAVKSIRNLRKTDFWPHPAVDTLFLELLKRPVPLVKASRLAAYKRFTEDCFSDPKKLAKMPLSIIGAVPGVSPSRLSLDQWLLLFHSQNRY